MLNPILKAISLFSILFLVSCSGTESVKDNETVLEVFDAAEAQGLQEIYDYFNEQICELTSESDPADCFKKFMDDIKEESPSTGVLPVLDKKESQDDFFAEIDKDLFDEIWIQNNYTDFDGGQMRGLELNNQGKYSEFLKEFGKEDATIAEYHNNLLRAGTMSASMVADVMMFPEEYDVSDVRVRLVLTIHYLTVCYQG